MLKKSTLFLFVLFYAHNLFALPIENPASPLYIKEGLLIPANSWGSIRIGYEGDFTTNGKMTQPLSNEYVDNFKLYGNNASFTVNLLNRLDIFALFGATKIKADWRYHLDPITFFRVEAQTKYAFSWTAGAKAVLFEWGKASLSFGGRYFYTNPKITQLLIDNIAFDLESSYMLQKAWQIDAGLSYKIDFLIPYICVSYAQRTCTITTEPPIVITADYSNTLKMKNRKNWGCTLGCGITNGKFFACNLEARLINEEAVTISGEFRF